MAIGWRPLCTPTAALAERPHRRVLRAFDGNRTAALQHLQAVDEPALRLFCCVCAETV